MMNGHKDNGVKVAVLGQGMLGKAVLTALAATPNPATGYDLPDWDITREADLPQAVAAAEVIINCAAATDVDGAESRREEVFRVNAEAVGNLGRLCADAGKYVVHISTDFVFDGAKPEPYTENDLPNPINVYGESKLAGEHLLQASGCAHCILRVEWTYGPHGANFVSKIVELARKRDTLKVVADQFGAPTSVLEVAKAIVTVLERQPQGLYHFAAAGRASRFEAACFIIAGSGLDCRAEPCSSNEFATPARRPLNSVFDCGKFDREIGVMRRPWQEPLRNFLGTLK